MLTGKHLFDDVIYENVMAKQSEHDDCVKKKFEAKFIKMLEKEHGKNFNKVKKVILKLVEYQEKNRFSIEELNNIFSSKE